MNYNIATGHITNSLAVGNSYTYTKRVNKTIPNSRETDIASLARDLYKKTSRLFTADYSSGASMNVMTKIGEFIDSYNELGKKIGSSSSNTAKDYFNQITGLLSENKSSLKNIGISFKESSSELKLDSEKLTKITSPYRLNTAFKGETNMLSRVIKYSSYIESNLKNRSVSQEFPSYQTVQLSASEASGATNTAALFNTLDSLSRYNYTESNRSSITDLISSYISSYNTLMKSNDSPLVSDLMDITDSYSTDLANSGISLSDNILSVDSDIINSAPIDNLKALFSGNNDYASEIDTKSRELFSEYVKAASNNLTLTR